MPAATFAAAATVRVELADPPAAGVTDDGLKVAITPDIEEEAFKVTAELKPLMEDTVIVDVPEVPFCRVSEF